MASRIQLATAAALTLGAFALGCGDSDEAAPTPSGAELSEAWDAEAEAAYEAAGKDRDADFAIGLPDVDCFFLDQAGAEAIAAALGHDREVEVSDSNFISGPPGEEERMVCGLSDPSATEAQDAPIDGSIAIIGAGTTLATADQHLERLLREDGATELEGSADGLDADEVVAVDREGVYTLIWVSEDFSVGVSGSAEDLGAEAGFDALRTAVDEVSRTLTG
jgi:hypothetical protein